MRLKKVLVASIIISLMMIVNSIFLISDIEEFFWGGSNYVFADFVVLNGVYPLLITMGMLIALTISKRLNLLYKSVLLAMFLIWILSGRIVGIRIYDNDCEVISGWFYVGTNYLNTDVNVKDEDNSISNHYKFNYLSFWRLEIEKKRFKETIFIGPFLWKDMKGLLSKHHSDPNSSSIEQ
jgi:hypothetical protein